jgi:sec-independent protein translocase protein TatC
MKEMTLEEHLTDLRQMFIRIVVIVFAVFCLCYYFGEDLSEILLSPLRQVLHERGGGQIIYTGLLDKLVSQIKVAFWSSMILSFPLWFREIWGFLRPGLYEHEAKLVFPFIIFGAFLFLLGVLFSYYIVIPYSISSLLQFGVQEVMAAIDLKDYLILSGQVLLIFGLMFQVPNILIILGFMGLVTKYSLRNMRRMVYFALAVAAAVVSPPDVLSMLILWFPLIILFELGIVCVAIVVHPILKKQVMSGQ